ncbi:acetyltransferase [Salmonella enterica subsp. enterica serovar Cotham]|uniref:Maltose O-acetyltransferase n=2 Tax=Salmonella enterica TaxID=28901 RepID=A0A379QWY9_SALER|nr:acetyltransferase [Salmonella enterica subsp. enterica serovar Anatum]EBL5784780.1 acetyltransferase [Salmonella enterica subsp. enterica serovar Montevideo]EBQ9797066.1 acetyltransferase [Salmonella enterica subsp. enterica serovar Kottbus]EBS4015648.1 acetyltransferase [Salmonella enterica subsp. enterica serovar Mikawasima]ECA6619354.1 acetyltransferase [Salmonella enterica subsp. enterica serovar Braenderup]ECN8537696.1 acetyltransferase [Salmonella enterica subsp. enterica serovar Kent
MIFDVLTYYFFILRKKKNPRTACILFNNLLISKRKRYNILRNTGVSVNSNSTIIDPFYFEQGKVTLLGKVFINANCVFLDAGHISIGNNTAIGPNVVLTTVTHPASPDRRPKETICAPINIGNNVWIGANSTILPGVSIGDNSVIACNSMVNANVPPNTLYAGTPAVFKKNLI